MRKQVSNYKNKVPKITEEEYYKYVTALKTGQQEKPCQPAQKQPTNKKNA